MAFRFFPRGTAAFFFLILATGLVGVERIAVDHAYVTALAEKLAAAVYRPAPATPQYFRELNYDNYRQINFKPDMTLWRDSHRPFQVQFFHPGYLFTQMVRLNEFSDTHVQPIPFGHSFFEYHDLEVPMLSRWGLDFAGFRVLHPLNRPEKWDEVVAFLGASYYRALGRNQVYGASARALALNAGGPATEEFPILREFWLGKPEAGASALTVHALLDGPSVAGAYTFVITPGGETLVETHATLFFRRTVDRVGFAALSSMFWFGEGTPARFGDFRPEVHDSDGLLVAPDANTRLWRPLRNAPELSRTEFDAPAFAGFGLLQRDRDLRSYADWESAFERRPSVWMEPMGPWPPGSVHLVEMPSKDEYHDNITVFWSPRDPIPPGRPLELAWKQHWSTAPTFGGPPGWVEATRQTSRAATPERIRYVIDFNAASLATIPASARLTANVTVSPGAKLTHSQVLRHEPEGSWRLVLDLEATLDKPVADIRAQLLLDQQPLTEIWTTRWQP